MATAYHPAPQQKAAIQIQLRGLQARFAEKRARGLGIYALFVGPCGTGKTLAGEVPSNELQLDLYHIDLSAIVNKYIGETEKNLRRLFDATEKGNQRTNESSLNCCVQGCLIQHNMH